MTFMAGPVPIAIKVQFDGNLGADIGGNPITTDENMISGMVPLGDDPTILCEEPGRCMDGERRPKIQCNSGLLFFFRPSYEVQLKASALIGVGFWKWAVGVGVEIKTTIVNVNFPLTYEHAIGAYGFGQHGADCFGSRLNTKAFESSIALKVDLAVTDAAYEVPLFRGFKTGWPHFGPRNGKKRYQYPWGHCVYSVKPGAEKEYKPKPIMEGGTKKNSPETAGAPGTGTCRVVFYDKQNFKGNPYEISSDNKEPIANIVLRKKDFPNSYENGDEGDVVPRPRAPALGHSKEFQFPHPYGAVHFIPMKWIGHEAKSVATFGNCAQVRLETEDGATGMIFGGKKGYAALDKTKVFKWSWQYYKLYTRIAAVVIQAANPSQEQKWKDECYVALYDYPDYVNFRSVVQVTDKANRRDSVNFELQIVGSIQYSPGCWYEDEKKAQNVDVEKYIFVGEDKSKPTDETQLKLGKYTPGTPDIRYIPEDSHILRGDVVQDRSQHPRYGWYGNGDVSKALKQYSDGISYITTKGKTKGFGMKRGSRLKRRDAAEEYHGPRSIEKREMHERLLTLRDEERTMVCDQCGARLPHQSDEQTKCKTHCKKNLSKCNDCAIDTLCPKQCRRESVEWLSDLQATSESVTAMANAVTAEASNVLERDNRPGIAPGGVQLAPGPIKTTSGEELPHAGDQAHR